ncbi:DUF6221 family protein [Streptomyces sp. NPDC003011]|uniref:DUF6221 family protein n=1 Tax=Streptomyces europaeiscabiei TaxID=146819 RepID=UPI0029AD9707|nr:DUF6221 family protein [Streptomyces europaeiscabiei]MDX3713771.1 DUF6221 family protein [Streptomyces europaeiscabiei]
MRHDFDVMVEFLKARLREDENAAKALKASKNEDVTRLRDRILADVEAKRRLMDWVFAPQWELGEWEHSFAGRLVIKQWMGFRQPVIEQLVAAYADHPDFHPEWALIEVEPIEDESRTRAQARTI